MFLGLSHLALSLGVARMVSSTPTPPQGPAVISFHLNAGTSISFPGGAFRGPTFVPVNIPDEGLTVELDAGDGKVTVSLLLCFFTIVMLADLSVLSQAPHARWICPSYQPGCLHHLQWGEVPGAVQWQVSRLRDDLRRCSWREGAGLLGYVNLPSKLDEQCEIWPIARHQRLCSRTTQSV